MLLHFAQPAPIFSCRALRVFFVPIIQYILNNRFTRKLFAMGRGSIYKRRVKVFTLAIVIYLDYKALQMKEKWTKKSKRADLWEKAHERNAKRVLSLIVELEGLWVKLGQYLSTRADVLPPVYISLLRQLQDSLPPRPLKEVCQTINRELGKSMDNIFLTFDNVPLATASVRCIVDGIILHDYLDKTCQSDDSDNRNAVLGHHLMEIEINLDEMRSVHVLIAYAHQIYVDGFFNGDPHPGNFLVSKAPPHRPILLDFGLTKGLSSSTKKALAKMFLASAEGDHVALLSSFAELGLKLRLDIPEQVMEISNAFFRNSTPANEAQQNVKAFAEQRDKNMKVLQEKMKLNKKEAKRFNPVDAFPGDIVIFSRVINLLRGLSSTLDVRIVYLDIMRPFAESVLQGNVNIGPTFNANWIHDSPVLSNVEDKLRKLLIELGSANKVLGIQVCAYKDGEVIIDTAAGVLGRYDPRPVQPDSLFPVFSVSKGITAGMVHWLADKGKLKLDDKVESVWPEFGSNGKDQIKVHHVLNHTSGLHNALASLARENPLLITDWDQCLNCLTTMAPETEPGHEQLYHYLSFGWLCGGIIEHASRKKFQEILEEAFIRPLNIDGELYIGIPPGVESRLATLTVDMDDIKKMSEVSKRPDLPSSFQFQLQDVAQMASTVPALFNTLQARRSIIPSANAHCSARALARYYASLVDRGTIPPPHSSSTQPQLGTHPHTPKFPSPKSTKKGKQSKRARDGKSRSIDGKNYTGVPTGDKGGFGNDQRNDKLFTNNKIHDAFMGIGEYADFALPDRELGLGFKRSYSEDGKLIGFGHSGMGGSTGYCDINNRFAIGVTLNKMNMGGVTAKVMQLVCSELNIPLPADFYRFTERLIGNESNIAIPLIN